MTADASNRDDWQLPEDLEQEDLVGRIKWTTLARVVALTAVLAFTAAMDLGLGPQPLARAPETTLYQVISTFYVLSFFILLAVYVLRARRTVAPLAWVSVFIDVLFATAFVASTRGTESMFVFTFPLAVLNAAVLLHRRGALVAATAASAMLVVLAGVDAGWLAIDLERWTAAYLRELGPPAEAVPMRTLLQVMVQVGATYATALLSSHLVMELRKARLRSVRQRVAMLALQVRYEDVFSGMPDGLLILDSDGIVSSANEAARSILGPADRPLEGQTIAQLLPQLEPTHDEAIATDTVEIERPAAVGGTTELVRQRGADEQQVLACRVVYLRDGDQRSRARLLVLRDLTRIRGREAEHRARERLAAIGSMATAVAHEIRNPLASISGSVQMLGGSLSINEAEAQLMEIVVRETAQLSEWIGEFLDFARPRKLSPRPCDLRTLVEQKIAAARNDPRVVEAKTRLTLAIEDNDQQPATAWILTADENSLSQLVWNLVQNACQAVLEVEDRHVEVALQRAGADLVLAVTDSGRGVAAEDRAHVFEPFYTTKGEGTGLGLATVRRIAESHSGAVEVEDGPLGGARFRVTLPRNPSLIEGRLG